MALLLPIAHSVLGSADGFDHEAFLTNNTATWVDMLDAYLPVLNDPVTNTEICPAPDCPDSQLDSEGYCKCKSSDEECMIGKYKR